MTTEQKIYAHGNPSKDPGEFISGFLCGVLAVLIIGLAVYMAVVPQPY
jgi:hypothetical protein